MGILDIKARLDNNIVCNVEMQVVKYNNIEKRIMYYWSKLYAGEIHEGQKYNDLNKTIVILISDFELDITKDIPKIHTKWEIREEEYSKIVLTNVLEIHIIEMPKLVQAMVNKKVDNKDKLILWTMFMLSPEELGDEIMEKNEDIKKAKEELDKINQDERIKELARLRLKHIMDTKAIQDYGFDEGKKAGLEAGLEEGIRKGLQQGIEQGLQKGIEQGIEQGLEKGIEQGLEQGKKEEKVEIAKNLLQMGLSTGRIIQATGLSKEEIENLNKK